MTRPVRASRPEGHYTTTRHHANRRGHKILEGHPAVDEHGRWLDPTPREQITPARDDHGRFIPEADSLDDEPATGEEES